MSYLLEIVGRGLISSLQGALRSKWPDVSHLTLAELHDKVQQHPEEVEAETLLGLKLLEQQEYMAAKHHFEQVISQDDEAIDAILGLAAVEDQLGQVSAALAWLNEARLIHILDPVILFCIGFCQEKLNNDEEALKAYRAALRACPELRNSHERLAAIFLRRGTFDLARYHYEQLVSLEPDRVADRLALANLYLKTGETERAIQHYEEAIARDPDNWALQDDLVTMLEKQGLIREAIEQLHQMINTQPDFADHYLRLGDLYGQAGDLTAAQQSLERALQLQPEYLEAMVKLGTVQLRRGEYVEAAGWFGKAVEINDRLLTACVGLGVAQFQAGRPTEGMNSLELAARIEPNSTLLFSETARMQLKAAVNDQVERYLGASAVPEATPSRRDQALQLIDKQIERHQRAICRSPSHADLHYRLGMLLKNRGRLPEAIDSFQEAVRINPNYEKALIKLGLALRESNRLDEALTVFRKANDINPQDAQMHYQLGLLFAEKHLFELAIEHFQKAQKGLLSFPDLKANLSLALQNAGLLDRAEINWRRICELDNLDQSGSDAGEPSTSTDPLSN
ncbi:MAG: Lipopolysaccharide assembly protein B [Phycisphaerae bacterium]|nr:Lipopolysaccharide assembly protein B [Phycisphaerae bacterium]